MVIIKKLAAEFKIQFAAELGNSLFYMSGLHIQILVIIKA